MYQCRCLACEVGLPHLAKDDDPLFTDDELNAFLRDVYNGSYDDGSFDNERASTYGLHFSKAIAEGYGKAVREVDYDTPDAAMLRALEKNVFHFSAAKNRSEIVSLSSKLIGEDGKLRSFASFRREAAQITGEFSGEWLKTEYDTAVGSATMAARWTEYSPTPGASLKYRTVGDARVREAHRLLDGIVRSVDDPFWNIYYPPNGWKCRCDVQRSTVSGDRGDIPPGAIDDIPSMFQINLAKEGLAFPPNHPYYEAMTPTAQAQLLKAQRDK